MIRVRNFSSAARIAGWAGASVAVVGLFGGIASGCRRDATTTARSAATAATPSSFKSGECRSCHEDIYKAWSGSHHALAHRPVDAKADEDALRIPQDFSAHGVDYRAEWKDGRPLFGEKRVATSPAENYVADFVLGHTPLRQYIVPIGGGRYQAAELAFDPIRKEWFNVFGDERRQPGEWGHWRGRGMNWNSMCAHCHMTDFRKNYDPVADTYATTWQEHGVGCSQCHAGLPASHLDRTQAAAPSP